jgi:hypothetical protein
MLTLRRFNPNGIQYSLNENYDGSTTIIKSNTTKSIKVNFGIDAISQAWYNWHMKGQLIQKAFPFFNADEREFLITGMTPEEWSEMLEKQVEE